MAYAQQIADLKDVRADAIARVRTIVNEGAVARAAMRAMRDGPAPVRCAWPNVVRDWADAIAAVDAEPDQWKPTAEQVDFAAHLDMWLGKRHPWEWRLLELRGWQVMFGKPSWRALADKLNPRPDGPMLSHEGWRQAHGALVDDAFRAAIREGVVRC